MHDHKILNDKLESGDFIDELFDEFCDINDNDNEEYDSGTIFEIDSNDDWYADDVLF